MVGRTSKLIKVTALVLEFISGIRRNPEGHPEIRVEKRVTTKILWYKDSQPKLEEKEKSYLTWEQLGVFKDESGVLRCKGRIQNSSLPYSVRFPILLLTKKHFTKLV